MKEKRKLKRSRSCPADRFSRDEVREYFDDIVTVMQQCHQSSQTEEQGYASPIRRDSQERGFILTPEGNFDFFLHNFHIF